MATEISNQSGALFPFIVAVSLLGQLPQAQAAETERPKRPTVAVAAYNGGTEITDFLVPYGVIAHADVADVIAVSTGPGDVELFPVARMEAHMTMAEFDRTHPSGADVVVVPAVMDPGNEVLITWLKAQADRDALIVSICDGSLVLAEAGLLDGRNATGHFYSYGKRSKDFPDVRWQTNTRYTESDARITSSGISASLPVALRLVELLGGTNVARHTAGAYGAADWSMDHNSDAFTIGFTEVFTVAKNWSFGWPRKTYALAVMDGVDEVSFAFAVDMLSRTYRSKAFVTSAFEDVRTAHGIILKPERNNASNSHLVLLPHTGNNDAEAGKADIGTNVLALHSRKTVVEDLLAHLSWTFGRETADLVALQLEYGR